MVRIWVYVPVAIWVCVVAALIWILNKDESLVAQCIVEMGPVAGMKDFCEAVVQTRGEW